MASPSFRVSCICGGISQLITTKSSDTAHCDLSLCHCDSCRHSSGVLCVSYYPIAAPVSLPQGLSAYRTGDGWMRYFCSTCGCHVLRSKADTEWELATGVIIETVPDDGSITGRYMNHVHVSETKDGGSAVWLPEVDGQKMETPGFHPSVRDATSDEEEHLAASCDCGRVIFHITRPSPASYLPRSNYSDVIYPYNTTDPAIVRNPGDEKWWIRDNGTKYLGGTCACRSCRLISGFEIQTWVFVPRVNIVFHAWDESGNETAAPLDFDTLPANILTSYRSSPDVLREFCGTCGATIFWHDKWRPDLIDVSAGLLRAKEGARAESWIDWPTGRVSFSEETEVGRNGSEARRAGTLISSLERGLLLWGKEK
ncbi:glutathione-dependent formaldehyde-activating enzyme [Mariannaea sp. PMI_226]|nr:glutathione-dependent formaldehyde-activating enzyme [Mariannaea sp. PMI_226]